MSSTNVLNEGLIRGVLSNFWGNRHVEKMVFQWLLLVQCNPVCNYMEVSSILEVNLNCWQNVTGEKHAFYLFNVYPFCCKWFEPRSISSSSSVIVRVRVVLKRTVVCEWHFDNLSRRLQTAQVVEMSVTKNSSFQNYPHPDDHTIRTSPIVESS